MELVYVIAGLGTARPRNSKAATRQLTSEILQLSDVNSVKKTEQARDSNV
jgi:hypothetical protein